MTARRPPRAPARCTDAELPVTADKFYAQHMQPARPAGHPQLDAKKTSYKQIGKFIKHMHKQKHVVVRLTLTLTLTLALALALALTLTLALTRCAR